MATLRPIPVRVASQWAAALVLASGLFLVLFDSLAVATALPTIGADLALTTGQLQWVVSLYSVAVGSLLLLGGRVADLVGRRRAFLAAIALMTAAGLLAGLAPSAPWLLTARALQGVAAAFALPAALAVIGALFRDEPWTSRAFSVLAVVAATAGLGGAVVGGMLTDAFGWRALFLVTVPTGSVCLLTALRVLPPDIDDRRRSRGGGLDVGGSLLASAGLLMLILGIARAAEAGPTDVGTVVPAGTGLALLAALVAVERRVRDPLLPLRLLRSRRLLGGCVGTAANSAAYSTLVVVGSLHLQAVHRLSPAATGIALAPALLGTTVGGLGAGRVLRALGSRAVATIGLALAGTALLLLGVDAGSAGYLTAVLPWLVLRGLAGGNNYVALTREAIGAAPEGDRGTISGVFEATTHMAGAVAVAVVVALAGSAGGFRAAYTAGAVMALLGAVAVFLLLPSTPPAEPSTMDQPGPVGEEIR
jgi:MFS family permease